MYLYILYYLFTYEYLFIYTYIYELLDPILICIYSLVYSDCTIKFPG